MLDLSQYEVDPTRGFLPPADTLRRLPELFSPWEDLAGRLPKIFAGDQLRAMIEGMPVPDTTKLVGSAQLERAMMLLSYLGHGYVWTQKPPTKLPVALARPWHDVAFQLGRPPVLSYASYALHNWERIDPDRGIELGNIALLQNFLGGIDEEWFILVHVDIEAKAASALSVLLEGQQAAAQGDSNRVLEVLQIINSALERM